MVEKKDVVQFVTAYGPRVDVGLDCSVEPSRTKQSFQDECDINRIMSKYEKTGLIDHVNNFKDQYLDCSGVVDYQSSLEFVMAAQDSFLSLPSVLRARFENDPAKFFNFVNNPANLDEMVALGLAKRKVEEPIADGSSVPPQTGAEPTAGGATS